MSPTPLTKKLRLASGQRALLLNAPEGMMSTLGELPPDLTLETALPPEGQGQVTYDWALLFALSEAELLRWAPRVQHALVYDGLFWIAYPKKSSGVETDLSRDSAWEVMPQLGLRPVAQVAVDATWSAVRYRPPELVGR
jgi:hypothetical protein